MKNMLIYHLYYLIEHIDGEKHPWKLISYRLAERWKRSLLDHIDMGRSGPFEKT